jgi:hypothetical protein
MWWSCTILCFFLQACGQSIDLLAGGLKSHFSLSIMLKEDFSFQGNGGVVENSYRCRILGTRTAFKSGLRSRVWGTRVRVAR